MTGELAALVSAFFWALSSVLLRKITTIPIVTVSALRSAFAALVYWALLLAFVGFGDPADLPLWAVGYLLFAVVVGFMVGDTLFLKGQQLIGVARAMPIASSYPLLTTLLAIVVLHEQLSPRTLLGIVVTVAGVYLIALPRRGLLLDASAHQANRLGLLAAIGASVAWSFSTIMLKPALEAIDPVLANALRLPFAAVLMLSIASLRRPGLQPSRYGVGAFALLAVVGGLHALSSGAYLVSLQLAGAAKAATLSSTAPLFAAPLAVLLVGERLTPPILVGTVLSVGGIWLVL